jgi:hypothetical protein
MPGSVWENGWFGLKINPNVHEDTVRKLSSTALYWCNKKWWFLCEIIQKVFDGTKYCCLCEFLALPRLDKRYPMGGGISQAVESLQCSELVQLRLLM